ncbi:MAG: hypothetical protein SGJ02_00125, partial [bacterium]|nr:hypothetical protein [bacterium]
ELGSKGQPHEQQQDQPHEQQQESLKKEEKVIEELSVLQDKSTSQKDEKLMNEFRNEQMNNSEKMKRKEDYYRN